MTRFGIMCFGGKRGIRTPGTDGQTGRQCHYHLYLCVGGQLQLLGTAVYVTGKREEAV